MRRLMLLVWMSGFGAAACSGPELVPATQTEQPGVSSIRFVDTPSDRIIYVKEGQSVDSVVRALSTPAPPSQVDSIGVPAPAH